jgi:hypothetical protein
MVRASIISISKHKKSEQMRIRHVVRCSRSTNRRFFPFQREGGVGVQCIDGDEKSGESAHTWGNVDVTRSSDSANGSMVSIRPGMMVLYERAREINTVQAKNSCYSSGGIVCEK